MSALFRVLEVSIDWITATASELVTAPALGLLCERIVASQMEAGYKRGPWGAYGYGGECTEQCSWGRKRGGTIIRLSGGLADVWFGEVMRHVDNVSRLDVEVTVQSDPPVTGLAKKAVKQLVAAGPGGREGAKWNYCGGSDGGSTCYIGSRSSALFFRLYDKWAEDRDHYPRGAWRYELEVKQDHALRLARHLADCADRTSAIRDTVYRYCVEHGLDPVYSQGTEGVQFQSPRPPVELERQCRWLQDSVSNTAREVVDAIGVAALLELLNIDAAEDEWKRRGPRRPHGHHGFRDEPQI